METRRLLLFIAISFGLSIAWARIGIPFFFPAKGKPAAQQNAQAAKEDDAKKKADHKAAGKDAAKNAETKVAEIGAANPKSESKPAEKALAENPAAAEKKSDAAAPAIETPQKLVEFPDDVIKLGSLEEGAETSYFLQATIASRGAALAAVELNDSRYHELNAPADPLKLLGSSAKDPATFETAIAALDDQLKPFNKSSKTVNWEIIAKEADPAAPGVYQAVELKYPSPDGKFEVRKRYAVKKIDFKGEDPVDVRDTNPAGYQIDLKITVKNLASEAQTVDYVLQGPSGLPLEDPDNTSKFRDIKFGYYESGEANLAPAERTVEVGKSPIAASKIVKDEEAGQPDTWEVPFKYIGVDVQYFTALLFPDADQLKTNYVAHADPMLLGKPNGTHSDISLTMTSEPLTVAAGEEQSHTYSLYAGPKREKLLTALGAETALDFGMLGFVSKPLIAFLKFLHDLGLPYGIAIIVLTIVVRACMFPLSLHQAKGAQKMKELQPMIAELKKKYGNDREKMARAQMELFSKHNYNPFAGCLPIFLQLPIFMGLYQALGSSVDLRAAQFLWIDNLAAPDALFPLPFTVPWLGWNEFNLLPIITIVLFIVQQKMFMPPAAPDDEQAQMQQKMMKYMMIFMGFMFYRVPAGLCVYFIASSLWGMGERKLLDLKKAKLANNPPPAEESGTGKKKHEVKQSEKQTPKREGLWSRLLAQADAAHQAKGNGKTRPDRDPKSKKKSRR